MSDVNTDWEGHVQGGPAVPVYSVGGEKGTPTPITLNGENVIVKPTNIDTSQSIIVSQNQSQSAAIDLGDGYGLIGFQCPAAIEATTARLSIQAALAFGDGYYDVKVDGVKFALTFAVNDYALISSTNLAAIFLSARYIKITLETAAGAAVSQATAARTFTVLKRPH